MYSNDELFGPPGWQVSDAGQEWADFNGSLNQDDQKDLQEWINSIGEGIKTPMVPIPKISENECELCLTFYFFDLSQPPVTICFRKKECRPQEEEKPYDPPKKPNLPKYEFPKVGKDSWEKELKCGLPGWHWVTASYTQYYLRWYRNPINGQWTPDEDNPKNGQSHTHRFQVYNPTKLYYDFDVDVDIYGDISHYIQKGIYCEGWRYFDSQGNILREYFYTPGAYISAARDAYNLGVLLASEATWSADGVRQFVPLTGRLATTIEIEGCDVDKPPYDRTKPPIILEPPAMDCCKDISRRLSIIEDQLLKLMRWTGADTAGMEVPEYWHDTSPGDNWLTNALDFVTPDKKRRIESIPQFYDYLINKLLETIGRMPIVAKDENDNETGFPNISEAIKGILHKQMMQDKSLASLQLAAMKQAVEIGLTRKETILAHSLSEAIANFLQIHLTEELEKVYMSFIQEPEIMNMSVSGEDLNLDDEIFKFFTTTETKVKTMKFRPDKEMPQGGKPASFTDTARRILKIYEILQMVHGITLDANNLHNGLKARMQESINYTKGKTANGESIDKESNDLSQWLNKVENQFASEENPPEGSLENPWGTSNNERPRIIIRGRTPVEGDDV